MNPYEILGISHSASIEDIEESYRILAKKHHPDLNQDDPDASKKFKDVQTAYEKIKRIKGTGSTSGFGFRSKAGFNDFDIQVNDLFSKSLFKGKNIQSKIEITLKDVLSGCKKELKVKKRNICTDCSGHGFSDFLVCEECNGEGSISVTQAPFSFNRPCGSCGGSGRINIKKCLSCSGKGFSTYSEETVLVEVPLGVEHGSQITLRGEGDSSLKGGKNGDLLVLVSVKPDPIFKREGQHVTLDVPVSYTQLIFGCELAISSISEETLLLKVPPHTQTGTKFRIRGKGLPCRGKADLGDMVVSLRLEVPKELNEEYESVLKKLSFLEEKYITSSRKSWKNNLNKESI